MRDEPDWSGRCTCSQTASHSAIAAITGSRKSFGCGLVKRMRSIPSTASQARSSSPNSVRMSGARSRPHELTFWPSSVSSLTPSRGEPRHLGEDLAGPAALLAAAHGRDDAVGADRVAAHRDLHPRLERPLAVHRQRRGERAVVEAEAAARDPDPARAEPVAEVRDRAGAEGDVDVGVELEDPLALRLGVAAADGDHAVGISPLARRRVAEVRGELRVGLLADRAGVEDDDVGVVGARRLAEPELLEQALDPLRVVSVHLAAEGGDVVAPHRQRVAAAGREPFEGCTLGCRMARAVMLLATLVAGLSLLAAAAAAPKPTGIQHFFFGPGPSTSCEMDVGDPEDRHRRLLPDLPAHRERGAAHRRVPDDLPRDQVHRQPARPGADARLRNWMTAGPFRCNSTRAGIKCFVVKTGKGFLISPTAIKRI